MTERVTRETLYGQVIYPEELPRKRGNMTCICSSGLVGMILALCLADSSHKSGEYSSFLVALVCNLSMLVVSELLWRLMNLPEEKRHLKSRHRDSFWHLIRKLLDFTTLSFIFIVVCAVSVLGLLLQKCDIVYHIRSVTWWQICGILIITNLLQRIIDLSKNPIHDSVFLEKLQRLDYGSGMAQNFFYGYLRLCLPNTGDQEKGIRERIEDYISKQRLADDDFPVRKLFILIPSSTYVPSDLKDISRGWMECAGALQSVVKDRAGVKQRSYKNTVYRIKDPDDAGFKEIYVAAEGATPCKTLYDVVQYSGPRQEFYKEHQKEIVYNFYETLRETLREDRDCRGLCEFIYYNDTDEFGLNNINVAKLILQRITEIQEDEDILRRVS